MFIFIFIINFWNLNKIFEIKFKIDKWKQDKNRWRMLIRTKMAKIPEKQRIWQHLICSRLCRRSWSMSQTQSFWICKTKILSRLSITFSHISKDWSNWRSSISKTMKSEACLKTWHRYSRVSRTWTWMETTLMMKSFWTLWPAWALFQGSRVCTLIFMRRSRLIWSWESWINLNFWMGCLLKERFLKKRRKKVRR